MDTMFDYTILLSGFIRGIRCRDEFVYRCEGSSEAYLYAAKKAHDLFDPGPGGVTMIAVIGPDIHLPKDVI